ncbi:MAG: MarR family winged helix-turn-helix transcriptional regulator [Gaiellales bacterium]
MNSLHNVCGAKGAVDRADALDCLLALSARLAEIMEAGITERGFRRIQASLLMRLRRAGPAMQRELSAALRVTPRHVTGLVDALEADGWVCRGPHPTDRRASVVSLTEQGKAVVLAMDDERRKWAEQVFAEVPGPDLAVFSEVLGVIGAAVSDSDPATQQDSTT